CTMALLALATALGAEEKVNEQGRAIKAFQDKVAEYAALHKKLEGGLPPVKKGADPTEIKLHQEALAKAISEARVNAAQGEILVEAFQPILKRVIEQEFKGPNGGRKHETIHEDMDGDGKQKLVAFVPKVNAAYPDGAPLTTVPPSLLLRL